MRDEQYPLVSRQVRVIMLLWAAGQAGLTPLSVARLHTLAYLSNVLAPVWDVAVFDGKLLKRRSGPFYPMLQREMDRLVGLGIVRMSGIRHVADQGGRWRVEGDCRLNGEFSDRIVTYLGTLDGYRMAGGFLVELSQALSALSDSELARASAEDATYADPLVDDQGVIDFAEWRLANPAAKAAEAFANLLPGGAVATQGERLHLYARHLKRRLAGAR